MTTKQARSELRKRLPAGELRGFARQLHVSRAAVYQWIDGASNPSREHVFEIERLLGIPAKAWATE